MGVQDFANRSAVNTGVGQQGLPFAEIGDGRPWIAHRSPWSDDAVEVN